MNHIVTQSVRGPLARIGRRVAAIVAECNYAQNRVASLRTPQRISDPRDRLRAVAAPTARRPHPCHVHVSGLIGPQRKYIICNAFCSCP